MFSWIKRIFYCKSTASARDNAIAHQNLNRLRQDELSVGAHMRRGEPVKTFPGVAARSMIRAKSFSPVSSPVANRPVNQATAKSEDGDFSTSLAVSACTGSMVIGYTVGGALTGAVVGSYMHNETPSHSHTPSGCESSSPFDISTSTNPDPSFCSADSSF
jgi:hypothetical protein